MGFSFPTEVREVLAEWTRVLKPGGVLRLAVPDFEALIAVYGETHDLNRVIGPMYGRWLVPGTTTTIYHRTVYDFASLKGVLEAGGLANVRRWDWRTTEHAAVDDYSQAYYPHMNKDHGRLISLNVEATKARA
jgi:ubiquinone/menaquinone biosynthesis C-methylase UbiE